MSKKLTYEFVHNYFKSHGCKLLELNYINNNKLMQYYCECGEIAYITFAHFKDGRRCKKCGINKNIERLKYTQEEAEHIFKKAGCELLELYLNAHIPVKFKCFCGNVSKIKLALFNIGHRCGCRRYRSGILHHKWNLNRDEVKLTAHLGTKYNGILRRALAAANTTKKERSHKILGYTRKELKKHITNNANWAKVKNKDWQIDHIFPIVAFVKAGILDIKVINALDNLQPLTASKNMSKKDHYDNQEFVNYLKSKNITVVSQDRRCSMSKG
jgi:hypothetical protein